MALNPFHPILRKLLALLVDVTVLPKDARGDHWGDKPVLYVMAARGVSDLLVLERICRARGLPNPRTRIAIQGFKHHSVYSVASRNPLSDWILHQKKHSLMLEELIKAIENDPELDITVVPVSVFWGRPIARQRHWLKVLFSDTWAVAGRLRKLFTILINGRATALIFSPPRSLRELVETAHGLPENLNELFIGQLKQQREATFGPDIARLDQIISRVIDTDYLQAAIQDEMNASGKGETLVRRRAVRYCREVFSDATQISQELMKRLLNYFWNRFYAGIRIYNIEPLKQVALTHQLVYVPCHRSHIDYLLLSYVLFNEGLALPYIAAGKNLNMPVIGRILRGGGAFFIRRSFKDNALYGAVMTGYLRELVDMGVPIEYFVEGGRSRTGRLLKPKLGMLSMTVEAWMRSRKRPLAFIPVYIGYEKLVEGRSYIGELYGQKKKSESLLASIRSILSLKGQFGKVTTSFGTPIKLDELLDQQRADWRKAQLDTLKHKKWFRAAIGRLSHDIMQEINRAAVINPVNLIATTLLATRRQAIDEADLLHQCHFYQRLIASQPQLQSIILQDEVNEQELERVRQQGLIHIHDHPLGNIIYLQQEHAILMSYYRNNSLHALIIPSLIACCFLNVRTLKQDKLISIVRYVYPFLASELHLQWDIAELDDFVPQIIGFLMSEKVLMCKDNKLIRPERSDAPYLVLERLAHVAQPILERYYMTFVVLWESGGNPLSEAELEQRCHLVAQKISMVYGINSPDFYDRQLFGHFIDTLFDLNFIERDDEGRLVFQEGFQRVNVDIRVLLGVEVRSTILQLLHAKTSSSIDN